MTNPTETDPRVEAFQTAMRDHGFEIGLRLATLVLSAIDAATPRPEVGDVVVTEEMRQAGADAIMTGPHTCREAGEHVYRAMAALDPRNRAVASKQCANFPELCHSVSSCMHTGKCIRQAEAEFSATPVTDGSRALDLDDGLIISARQALDVMLGRVKDTASEGSTFQAIGPEPQYAHETPGAAGVAGGAIAEIAAERRRQIEVEGWNTQHDDQEHADGELADAAACYAIGRTLTQYRMAGTGRPGHPKRTIATSLWPWELRWWKPTTPRRNLVKAGALIVAEIDRLDRQTAPPVSSAQSPEETPVAQAEGIAQPAPEADHPASNLRELTARDNLLAHACAAIEVLFLRAGMTIDAQVLQDKRLATFPHASGGGGA